MTVIRPINIAYAQQIMQERGPTYASAVRFFPASVRARVGVLYAFLREPDDIVDELTDIDLIQQKLGRWIEDWALAWKNPDAALNPVLRESAICFQQYGITWADSQVFLDAMKQDTDFTQPKNLIELQSYMYGSAGVVGQMMVKLLLPTKIAESKKNMAAAALLGDAMQLTNFLRDIASDYADRQRIYLPLDVLNKHGVTTAHFVDQTNDQPWKSALAELITLTRAWFISSEKSLSVFPWYLRWQIRYACQLYKHYLTQIENSDYDVWDTKYRLNRAQKIRLLFSTFFS
jgi:phytoene synthase